MDHSGNLKAGEPVSHENICPWHALVTREEFAHTLEVHLTDRSCKLSLLSASSPFELTFRHSHVPGTCSSPLSSRIPNGILTVNSTTCVDACSTGQTVERVEDNEQAKRADFKKKV